MRQIFSISLIAMILVVLGACGGDSDSSGADVVASGETNEYGFQVSMTAKPDSVFTLDDVKSTGWKSSKELWGLNAIPVRMMYTILVQSRD